MSLKDKIAIVTGGSRDIGRAVSETLAAQGAKVVVNYFNNASEGEATVAAIKNAGGEAIAVKGDMTKQADVDNLVAWLAGYGEATDNVTAEQVAGVPAAQICVTCHGVDGASVKPAPPTLSGQQEDYLVHALNGYKDGARSGSVMSAFAATLTDADIKLIAGFYASQDGVKTLD